MTNLLLGSLCLVLAAASAVLLALRLRDRSALRRTSEHVRSLESRVAETRVHRSTPKDTPRSARDAKRQDARQKEFAARDAELKRKLSSVNERRVRHDERAAGLDRKAEELAERAGRLDARAATLELEYKDLEQSAGRARTRLEEIAGLTSEAARSQLLDEIRSEIKGEVARLVQKGGREARAAADETAKETVLRAMATLRGGTAREGTVSIVQLPNDDMKGRIIGREGRNIRALEHALGVDLMVDDTPGAILLSCWDPHRRAVAARALQTLVEDGRIHPARIEDVVEKTRSKADDEARERGEQAAFELGLTGIEEHLLLCIGRLAHFTDRGQNVLQRSKEVGLLAGAIGDELKIDGDVLRRAGLLHEVARADKAAPMNRPANASAELSARHGESSAVTDAIRTLAQPADAPRTPHGVALATARRMAISRPGARNDNLQRHLDRLANIEQLALTKPGVDRAFAVHAGKELRVHIRADGHADEEARQLARGLAREIEKNIDYNGSIRVLVIRETRAVSYAV